MQVQTKELIGLRQRFTELEKSETERKKAEAALRESELRYRILAEAAQDFIYLIGPDMRIKYVNNAGAQKLQSSPEDIIGKQIDEFFQPEEDRRRNIKKVFETGEQVYVEKKYPFPGGDLWLGSRLVPVENKAGGISAVLGLSRDITKRKRAEEQLMKQNTVLDAINSVFQETLTCETDEKVARTCLAVAEELTGSKFGFICEVNQAGRFDTIAISDPGWGACIIPKTKAVLMVNDLEIRGIRGRVFKDEQAMIFNDPSSHPDWVGTPEGHPPITCFLCVPLKHTGRTIGMIAVANKESGYDLADKEAVETLSVAFVEALNRKRAEEELARHTQELARSNAELEQFAYVTSHDLQEPLRKIQAFGDRLKAGYDEALDERGHDYLERMQNAAGRMQTLINDLLKFSRVTTKAQPLVQVNLAEVVREVVDSLEAHIERTGGRVEVDDMPTIDADPTQMRQLLQNLISNGLKFHKEEEPPVVRVHGKLIDNRCQITVEDNGIGFDEKYLDRIFTIFQRLHGRLEYEGTGVGLAICRKIVERHGGSITAKSTPGQGAKFIVTLPVKQLKEGNNNE